MTFYQAQTDPFLAQRAAELFDLSNRTEERRGTPKEYLVVRTLGVAAELNSSNGSGFVGAYLGFLVDRCRDKGIILPSGITKERER